MLDADLDCCCQGEWTLDPGQMTGDPAEEAEEGQGAYFEGFTGLKPLSEYADPLSTGRKEAVKVAPITTGMICEWSRLKNAGGGIVPIVGCPGHPASDVHHGPDKNTMHNALGTNLHRICDWCHNTWHAKNDPYYGKRPTNADGSVDASKPFLPLPEHMDKLVPHDPSTKASDDEVYAVDRQRQEENRRHGRG